MDMQSTAPPRSMTTRRWASWGFIAGVAITWPAAALALLSPTGEALQPYLTPGPWLLQPVADTMASWPGLINVLVASVSNGLVYGTLAGVVGAGVVGVGGRTLGAGR